MVRFFLFALLGISLTYSLSTEPTIAPDTAVQLLLNQITHVVPFHTTSGPDKNCFTESSALHGRLGFAFNGKTQKNAWIPYTRDHWIRVYLRLDSCQWLVPQIEPLPFLEYQMLQKGGGTSSQGLFTLYIGQNAKTPFLLVKTLPDLHHPELSVSLIPGQAGCFEAHFERLNKDSLNLNYWWNGQALGGCRIKLFDLDSTLSLVLTKYKPYLANLQLSLDDFLVSSQKAVPIPPVPSLSRFDLDSVPPGSYDPVMGYFAQFRKSRLTWHNSTPLYRQEAIRRVEWRLCRSEKTAPPLLDLLTTDTTWVIPFPLDSGNYTVQIRAQNNFERWSDWSLPQQIAIPRYRQPAAQIKEIWFSDTPPPSGRATQTLYPEKKTYLNVRMTLPNKPTDGYLIVYLTHPEYPGANPDNKGGVFLSSSNYIFNLSKVGQQWTVFEKSEEGQKTSSRVTQQRPGRIIDLNGTSQSMQAEKALLTIHFKLLENAIPGEWNGTAFYRTVETTNQDAPNEDYSNVYQFKIRVHPSLKKRSIVFSLHTIILWGIAAGCLVLLLMAFFRKYGQHHTQPFSTQTTDPELASITTYLKAHAHEPLSVDKVIKPLNLSEARFFAIFKRNNIKYSALLQAIRIEKAKGLLLSTSKTISEIAFEVGFSELPYFCKIFKKSTGVSPKDFRTTQSTKPL